MLFAAVLVGAAISLTHLIFFNGIDYRDTANVYAAMSRALVSGAYPEAFHPAIPSLNVILSRGLTLLGMAPDVAMSAVSCMFYVATIPFVYLLLKCFLPDEPAAFGTVLFACAPKIIRFSCAGLLDSGKVFFLVAGLYFSCRLVREKFRSFGIAAGFGVALGGLSLARSEGIGNACVLFGCTALFWLWASRREKRVLPVLPLVTTVAVWALALLSRVLVNGWFCGQFMYDARVNTILKGMFEAFLHTSEPAAVPAAESAMGAEEGNALLDWLELIRKNIVGNYELYFGFAAAGVVLMVLAGYGRRRSAQGEQTSSVRDLAPCLWPDKAVPDFVKWDPFFLVLIVSVACNAVIFKLSNLDAYRYFLLNIPLFMVFTVMACWWFWRWAVKLLPRPLLRIALAGVAVILVFQVRNGVDNLFSEGTRMPVRSGLAAGEAIRAENADGRVYFVSASIEWYYSGAKRAIPIETAQLDCRTGTDFDYFLVCKDEDDILPVVESRTDLREIPLPPESTVRLFRKLKED
ncbi:MAG: glycosyltransferase family 39 protein [Lentisphaeria bacterium]|nr:glycosyltransferase family 39 protein [Lentisphaeria bacterium]